MIKRDFSSAFQLFTPIPWQGERGHLAPLIVQPRALEPVQELEQLGHGAHVGGRRGRHNLPHVSLCLGLCQLSHQSGDTWDKVISGETERESLRQETGGRGIIRNWV